MLEVSAYSNTFMRGCSSGLCRPWGPPTICYCAVIILIQPKSNMCIHLQRMSLYLFWCFHQFTSKPSKVVLLAIVKLEWNSSYWYIIPAMIIYTSGSCFPPVISLQLCYISYCDYFNIGASGNSWGVVMKTQFTKSKTTNITKKKLPKPTHHSVFVHLFQLDFTRL